MKFHQLLLLSAFGNGGLVATAESEERRFSASEEARLSLFRTLTEEDGSLLPIVNPPTASPFSSAPASGTSAPVAAPFTTQAPSAVAGEIKTSNPTKASKKKTKAPNASPIAKVKASKSPIAAKAKKTKSPKAKKTKSPKAKKTKSPKAKKTKSPKAKKTKGPKAKKTKSPKAKKTKSPSSAVKGQKTPTPSVVGRVEAPSIAKSKAKIPSGKASKLSSENGEKITPGASVQQASERTSALVDGSTAASSGLPTTCSRVLSVASAGLILVFAIMV